MKAGLRSVTPSPSSSSAMGCPPATLVGPSPNSAPVGSDLRAVRAHAMTSIEMRARRPFAALLVLAACDGRTLDAGSTHVGPLSVAPPPTTTKTATTRATLPAMVDAVAMDATSLYFTCEDGGVYRLEKAGTAPPEHLATFPGQHAWGIAVDDASVYWTALADGLHGGVVLRAPKSGGEATVLAASRLRPWGIALDDHEVFWIDQGSPSEGKITTLVPGSVQAVSKGGGSVRPLTDDVAIGDALALTGDALVWHESQAIRRLPRAGGTPVALLETSVPFAVSNLVPSSDGVVFAYGDGSWSIRTLGDAGPSTLAADVAQPAAVLVDGSTVFWSTVAGGAAGEIRSVPVGGGAATVVWPSNASSSVRARALVADAAAFYSVEYVTEPTLTVSVRVLPR